MPYTPQDSARNILAQTGDTSSQLAIGRSLSGNIASNIPNTDYDPNQQFGLALMGLLQQAQGLGTAGFQKAGFAGQQEQINRTLSTPQNLIGASPQLQASVRGASVGAVEPTITGAQNLQKTFGEQLGSLKDAISYADQLSFRHEQQLQKAKDDSEKQFHNLLATQGSSFLDALSPEQKKDWEKRLGYPTGLLDHLGRTMKEQELALKQQSALQSENIKQQNLLLSQQRLGLAQQRFGISQEQSGTDIGSYLGLKPKQSISFEKALSTEINNVQAGKYGTRGAREKALSVLQTKFPGIATKIPNVIYGTQDIPGVFPNGYENTIGLGTTQQQRSLSVQEQKTQFETDLGQGLDKVVNSSISPSDALDRLLKTYPQFSQRIYATFKPYL